MSDITPIAIGSTLYIIELLKGWVRSKILFFDNLIISWKINLIIFIFGQLTLLLQYVNNAVCMFLIICDQIE